MHIQDVGTDPAALMRFRELAARLRVAAPGVPAFYLRGELIIGYAGHDTTGKRIRAMLQRPAAERGESLPEGACGPELATPCGPETRPIPDPQTIELPLLGRLSVREVGLPAFTVAIGLLDGFNPCSMWVLVFVLSLLATLRNRTKMVLVAGTFIAIQGLAYFAFMAAWLNVFLLIGLSRITELVLGAVAGVAGAINVKDFWALGRGVSLGIPDSAKPGLYARIRAILQAEDTTTALVGIAVLAVLVQVVEFLCTAGFPALYSRILTMRELDWWAYYGYLILYNLAYMFDDAVVLAIGVLTLSRARLQEREGRWLKLVSGLVMLGLGTLLLVKPEWLAGQRRW
jgi:hypothetical protein